MIPLLRSDSLSISSLRLNLEILHASQFTSLSAAALISLFDSYFIFLTISFSSVRDKPC